jgi:hypothetical protein
MTTLLHPPEPVLQPAAGEPGRWIVGMLDMELSRPYRWLYFQAADPEDAGMLVFTPDLEAAALLEEWEARIIAARVAHYYQENPVRTFERGRLAPARD